jgi:uncharacterized membrane protein YkvA (DUF1232 family)
MRKTIYGIVLRMSLRAWKDRVKQLKTEVYALYLAYKDPRVPWYAKLLAVCVVGYAFSPIDLIPDPIPVLGYLDDLIVVPLGIILAVRMIPDDVLDECREKARIAKKEGEPTSWVAAAVVIAVWLILAALAVVLVRKILRG